MKLIVTILFVCLSTLTFAQSKSFSILKEKFAKEEDVTTVRLSGLVLKTILWMSGESEWSEEFGSVESLRVMSIPQREFQKKNLSATGFKKVLGQDNFEELASTFDDGERLTIFMQDREKRSDLYFLLVESDKEVTAIEIKGVLNAKKIVEHHQKKHLNKT